LQKECAQNFSFFKRIPGQIRNHLVAAGTKSKQDGSFAWEITPLAIKSGKEQKFVEMDEQPFKANLDKIPTLKPRPQGRHGHPRQIRPRSPMALQRLVLMRRSTAEKRGLAPIATIIGHSTHAQAPGLFTTHRWARSASSSSAPDWSADKVDLYESTKHCGCHDGGDEEHPLPHDRVNVHGGACALGIRSAPRARGSWSR